MGYHRVNLDGKSITETRLAAEELSPGTIVVINSDGKFEQAEAGSQGRLYIVGNATHVGGGIKDKIPAGESVVADYVEDGREFALLVPAGVYTKDAALNVGSDGRGALGTTNVIAYSQDTITLAAEDHIRVRILIG